MSGSNETDVPLSASQLMRAVNYALRMEKVASCNQEFLDGLRCVCACMRAWGCVCLWVCGWVCGCGGGGGE